MARDLQFRIEEGEQLAELIRALKDLEDGKEIAKRLRRGLREAARPMVPAVRQAVLALPSSGLNARRGRQSLRRSVAKATALRVRTSGKRPGVVVWVNPRRMPAGQRNLPAYMEGLRPFHRWRHPVYGDEDTWVTQAPTPYFYRAIRPHEDRVADAGREVIRGIADEIANR